MKLNRTSITPTGIERPWHTDEIIVSKTDLKGIITYANDVFLRVSMYSEQEMTGKPHNIIRHPDMPRVIFRLLWDTLKNGKEIFAYVNNMARNGDNYWVFAHVTPSRNNKGEITGYHSTRRKPDTTQIEKIKAVYDLLLSEERKHSHPQEGIDAASAALEKFLETKGMTYEQFVFSL